MQECISPKEPGGLKTTTGDRLGRSECNGPRAPLHARAFEQMMHCIVRHIFRLAMRENVLGLGARKDLGTSHTGTKKKGLSG